MKDEDGKKRVLPTEEKANDPLSSSEGFLQLLITGAPLPKPPTLSTA